MQRSAVQCRIQQIKASKMTENSEYEYLNHGSSVHDMRCDYNSILWPITYLRRRLEISWGVVVRYVIQEDPNVNRLRRVCIMQHPPKQSSTVQTQEFEHLQIPTPPMPPVTKSIHSNPCTTCVCKYLIKRISKPITSNTIMKGYGS